MKLLSGDFQLQLFNC